MRWCLVTATLLLSMWQAPAGALNASEAPAGVELSSGLLPSAAAEQLDAASRKAENVRHAIASGSIAKAYSAISGLPLGRPPDSHEDAIENLVTAAQEAAIYIDLPKRAAAKSWAPRMITEVGAEPMTIPAAWDGAARRTPAAAVKLVQAVDAYLSIEARNEAPSNAEAGASCDLIDNSPLLCIASQADNVHIHNYAVTIDLGGNDTYENAAGAAPVLARDGELISASVNIDLGGDDTYDTDSYVAQGSAFLGGVGILVDVAGDDTYRAKTGLGVGGGLGIAQGGGFAGVGLLFDQAGSDRYELVGADDAAKLHLAVAQGSANYCGASTQEPYAVGCPVGVLADTGLGDDEFLIDSGKALQSGQRFVAAQGYGNFGAGVLSDDGGTNTVRVSAGAVLNGLDSYPIGGASCPGGGVVPSVCINTQGVAVGGGYGMVLGGSGNTVYEVDVENEGAIWSLVRAQGHGALHALGVINDSAGDDQYRVSVTSAFNRDIEIRSGCRQSADGCPDTPVKISARPGLGNDIFAQGAGFYIGGAGVIADASGDDVYSVVSSQSVKAVLTETEQPLPGDGPTQLDVVAYRDPTIRAQGASDGPAIGLLIDSAGTDLYEIEVSNSATALAASVWQEPQPSALTSRPASVFVQGVSTGLGALGALLDLAGIGDEAKVEVSAFADAQPGLDNERVSGSGWPWVQGSWGGSFAMLGVDPLVISSPSMPTCETSSGARGFGSWNQCLKSSNDPDHQMIGDVPIFLQHSSGLVPGALGEQPSIAVTAPASAQNGSWVEVSATMSPALAGSAVHFAFQRGCEIICLADTALMGTYWYNVWEADAVLDESGSATVRLPVTLQQAPLKYHRFYVTYDGAKNRLPAHAEKRIAVL